MRLNRVVAEPNILGGYLATLDEAQLAALLARRPDVLLGAPPRDLAELAHRLWHGYSLLDAVRAVALPHMQVLEAAVSLGDGCTRSALADLLAGDGLDHRAEVDRVLDDLSAAAILTGPRADTGALALPAAFDELLPDPLHLGRPLAKLLPSLSVDQLRHIMATLGLPKQAKRAAVVAALETFYADAENVFALLASASPAVLSYLNDQVGTPPEDQYDDDPYDDDRYDGPSYRADFRAVSYLAYEPAAYRARLEAEEWAAERGLVISVGYGFGGGPWVPAEVARALRGRDYRAPFDPQPPELVTRPAEPPHVQQASAAAASSFLAHLLGVLDQLTNHPVTSLKSGGVGTRELAKLAKTCSVDDATLRLALECADELGLLERRASTIAVSPQLADWRAGEPGAQLASVIRAWWTLGLNPTESRAADGKPLPALGAVAPCGGCRDARTGLLRVLAEQPDGVAVHRSDLARRVLWHHPFVHVAPSDADDPFVTPWRESELFGLLAFDALTSLGRALLDAETEHDSAADPLAAAARTALPPVADRATFGSDLTAYAVGAPSARVTAALDAVADRESSGGAVTWRFSPASVRRAFDGGASGEAVLAGLTEIAGGELPQPLRYLIGDVARRHGHLRLSAATTCVRSDDVALLAEVAADRKLAKFDVRLLAPTVLTAEAPLDTLLAALRTAGYLPVLDEPATAPAAPEPAASSPRAALRAVTGGATPQGGRAPLRAVPDPAAVAAALLRRGRPSRMNAAAHAGSPTEIALRELHTSLSPAELRQLADAIDTRGRVLIDYRSKSGGRTTRVISDVELTGQAIYAWCELRSDDRFFAVSRILSVAAV